MFGEEWSEEHLLHPDYTQTFKSCSKDDWTNWIVSGRSSLIGFAPILNIPLAVYGRERINLELEKRDASGGATFQYVTQDFRINDWDFAEKDWKVWRTLAAQDPTFWSHLLERILKQPVKYWSEARSCKIVQVATTGNTHPITHSTLTPSWILKLRELPCLKDTHGRPQKPTDLLCRTPATEAVIDVEPFVHSSLDTEANRPLLNLLGVRDVPTGPGHLLDRLRALSKSASPPVHEVEKWYRRLDIMWDSCSTDDADETRAAFQTEKLIFTDGGLWSSIQGVFLNPDAEDVPDAQIIRSSVANLMIWQKIGVAERPTVDLAIEWLQSLESGDRVSANDLKRIKALQKRHPLRIWQDCGHWLNLANEWAPVDGLSYSLTLQSLVAWTHLHEWVKQRTADFQSLAAEITSEPPFSLLKPLAFQLTNRLNNRPDSHGEVEKKPWLSQLGTELARIVAGDSGETERIRKLGRSLAASEWHVMQRLEILPYIDGIPAGVPVRKDAEWIDNVVYVENRSAARLAGSVSKTIGSFFNDTQINDAIKICFERDPKFVIEYMEENFKLAPRSSVVVNESQSTERSATDDEDAGLQTDDRPTDNEPHGPFDKASGSVQEEPERNDRELEDRVYDDFEEEDEDENEDSTFDKRRPKKPPKPNLIERFAVSLGFEKSDDPRFRHPDGGWIGKTENSAFPWERRSPSGSLLRYYWPREHCLENKPLIIDTDAWRMIDKYPHLYSMVLLNIHGEPVEMTGSKLEELSNDGKIRLYPAAYRLAFGK